MLVPAQREWGVPVGGSQAPGSGPGSGSLQPPTQSNRGRRRAPGLAPSKHLPLPSPLVLCKPSPSNTEPAEPSSQQSRQAHAWLPSSHGLSTPQAPGEPPPGPGCGPTRFRPPRRIGRRCPPPQRSQASDGDTARPPPPASAGSVRPQAVCSPALVPGSHAGPPHALTRQRPQRQEGAHARGSCGRRHGEREAAPAPPHSVARQGCSGASASRPCSRPPGAQDPENEALDSLGLMTCPQPWACWSRWAGPASPPGVDEGRGPGS